MTVAMAKMLLKAFEKGSTQGARFYKPIADVAKQYNVNPGAVLAQARSVATKSRNLRIINRLDKYRKKTGEDVFLPHYYQAKKRFWNKGHMELLREQADKIDTSTLMGFLKRGVRPKVNALWKDTPYARKRAWEADQAYIFEKNLPDVLI
tara:strand:- start:710 stop:1159 length:450 start_codon:yes stop_codon:yes gene_type:complete